MTEKQEMIDSLRKTADQFREKAAAYQRQKHIKCAHVLTAARGLAQFKRILRGADK